MEHGKMIITGNKRFEVIFPDTRFLTEDLSVKEF